MLIKRFKLTVITNFTGRDMRRANLHFFTAKGANEFDETFSSMFTLC